MKIKKVINFPSKKDIAIYSLFFCIGLGAAIYLYWPALTSDAMFKSDLRQAPHWAAFHNNLFQENDLLLHYSSFNVSPLQNTIYYLGTFFFDVITLSKTLSVLSYGFATLLFFIIGRKMFGVKGGILTALFFTFFPDQFGFSQGFFSKFWIIPSLLLSLYFLQSKKSLGLLLLLPFGAIAYPPIPFLMGVTILVYIIIIYFEDKSYSIELIKHASFGALISIGILLIKYINPNNAIGPMTSGAALLKMPEMLKGGLLYTPYVPIPTLFEAFLDQIIHPFTLFSFLIFILVLRKNIIINKSWIALFIASIICYGLADYYFMELYIPNRYSRYSMALLLILFNAANWNALFEKIKNNQLQYAMFFLMIGAASISYSASFRQGKGIHDSRGHQKLTEAVSELPPKVLIAGPPYIMDDIPLMAKRSVLCNFKMAHPWFKNYYKSVKERTEATFIALFATNRGSINYLNTEYGVTHLIVEKTDYSRRKISRNKFYVKPYNQFIKKITEGKLHFTLESPPKESIVYNDKKFQIIKLPLK